MSRWLCLVALAGCSIPQSEFAARKADALCALERRCALGNYYDDHATRQVCLRLRTGEVRDELEESELCTYRPDEAARCVQRLRSLPCDEYARGELEEPCDLVFDCGFAQ